MKLLTQEIETVIFDKDGTLIDLPSVWIPWIKDAHFFLSQTMPDCQLNLKEYEEAFGFSETDSFVEPEGPLAIASVEESITIIALLLYRHEISWDKAISYARESTDFANEKQNSSIQLRLIEGIVELLEQLQKQGKQLGVITADDTKKAWMQLEKLQIANYFQFIIGSDLVERGKPFPDMAFLARDQYSVNLEKTVMIGDTGADIQLAKRAGMKMMIGITCVGKEEATHLKEADWVVSKYDELLEKNKEAKK
jgi:phosphoglycolate phosphatase